MALFNKQISNKQEFICDQIIDLFSEKGIKYKRNPENETQFFFGADVDGKVVECYLYVDIERSILTFEAFLQLTIPEEKYLVILDFINRVNEYLWYGTFQLYVDGKMAGRVWCKTTLPIDNATPSMEQLDRLCFSNLYQISVFQDSFSNMVNTNCPSKDTFDAIEQHIEKNKTLF